MASNVGYRKYKNDEEKAKTYNHRLSMAQKEFDEWQPKAEDWWDRYENIPKTTQATRKGLLVNVTTGTSVIDALFSGLTAVDVEFTCEAQGVTTPEQAYLAETVLNQEWQKGEIDDERDDAIKDSLITGIGWLKVAYDFFENEEVVERNIEEYQDDVARLIAQAEEAGEGAPDPETIARLVPDTETVRMALRDRIVVDYVPWDSVRWDPTAKRWKDVRWVAQLTKMQLFEVQNNPQWRDYVKRTRGGLKRLEDVKPDTTVDQELIVRGKPTEDDGRVTVVEMWDLESGSICTFIKGNNWLLNETVNPFAMLPDYNDRSGFVPLVMRKTTRRVRGVSDMDVMIRSLNEKNLYRSRTATYIQRAVPKVVMPEDALTEEGKEALSNDEVLAAVSVGRDIDPGSIIPLNPPVLPEQAFNMNDRIDDEIREATGVNELMRGLFPDRKRTATETAEVVSASAARQSEKRNTLERFHVQVAKRMLHLMMMFYDEERMVRYLDPSVGNIPWGFTGEDIIGEFSIGCNLEPREAPTRDQQRQEATVALNVLGPLAQPGPDGSSIIDPTKMVAWFMRKYGFSPRDINELLTDETERQAQQEQQLGMAAAAQAAGGAVQDLQTAALPPDMAAAATMGGSPVAPAAAQAVSENRGVAR